MCLSHNIVCVNLGPKAAISRGEQNRYGWRRRTVLTARLIKFYGGLRLMKSTAAYVGGLQRRLGALGTGSSNNFLQEMWDNAHETRDSISVFRTQHVLVYL